MTWIEAITALSTGLLPQALLLTYFTYRNDRKIFPYALSITVILFSSAVGFGYAGGWRDMVTPRYERYIVTIPSTITVTSTSEKGP